MWWWHNWYKFTLCRTERKVGTMWTLCDFTSLRFNWFETALWPWAPETSILLAITRTGVLANFGWEKRFFSSWLASLKRLGVLASTTITIALHLIVNCRRFSFVVKSFLPRRCRNIVPSCSCLTRVRSDRRRWTACSCSSVGEQRRHWSGRGRPCVRR